METWGALASQLLVRTALAAVPLALIVAAVCRWMPARPATRHALWLVLLAWFLVSPLFPGVPAWNRLTTELASLDVESHQQAPRTAQLPDLHVIAAEPSRPAAAFDEPKDPVLTSSRRQSGGQSNRPHDTRCSADSRKAEPTFSIGGLLRRANSALSERLDEWSSRIAAVMPRAKSIPNAVASVPLQATPTHRDDCGVAELSAAFDEPDHANAVLADAAQSQPDTARAGEGSSSRWAEWIAWLLVARDALARLLGLPPAIVLTGMIVFCGCHAARTLVFYRRLGQTNPAPASVNALVQRCAKRIGLRRTPVIQMTRDNVSPMIWCGRRARLILPKPLWSQLDAVGREAIVCHELAHLRRRDHWWCWGDLLAGTLYWWHPLVWWVRRRLHEEAEFSCDAWVIWLLPHGRRAYAEALLRTKETVGRASRIGPAVGMAVEKGRGRQFARRLTMVMTQSTRPSMSIAGLALAAMIAATGWAAVPARSCPPESRTSKTQPVATVVVSGASSASPESVNVVIAQPAAAAVGAITAATACPPGEATGSGSQSSGTGTSTTVRSGRRLGISGTSNEVTVVEPGSARPRAMQPALGGVWRTDGDARIATLEKRVAELSARIEELSAQIGRTMPGTATRPPSTPREVSRNSASPRASSGRAANQIVVRSYKLPKGKLEALWELMSRSDVPTKVRSIEGGIEVQATEAQHEVFGAFVRLINPQEGSTPRAGAQAAPRARGEAKTRAEALRERLQSIEERTRATAAQRKAELESREQLVEHLREQAESLREHADSIREHADGMKGHGKADPSKAQSLLDNAKGAEEQAKSIEQQMKSLEREARELEKLGDALNDETESLGSLRETIGELPADDLAGLLRQASQTLKGEDAKTLSASMGALTAALESDAPATLDEALKKLDVGTNRDSLKAHAKALERLCDTLREKSCEAETQGKSKPEKGGKAKAKQSPF